MLSLIALPSCRALPSMAHEARGSADLQTRPTRRPALMLALAMLLLVFIGCAGSGEAPTPPSAAVISNGNLLTPPPSIESKNGVLEADLDAVYALTTWGDDPVYLRTYDGALVGPTLRARPGDTLKINLYNKMPPQDHDGDHDDVYHHGDDGEYNDPHGFNVTNLHTHGLWVSPSGISDNVMLSIDPGAMQHYEIEIPEDHPPGTHWYHPHKHGSVALQMTSGMAGLLIIEGGLDDVPEIAAAKEQVFVLQQFAHTEEDCESIDPIPDDVDLTGVSCIETYDNFGAGDWAALERPSSINGQVQPTLTLRPGEVQHWRFLQAAIRESIDLAIIDPGDVDAFLASVADGTLTDATAEDLEADYETLYVIAEDGIAYGRVDEYKEFNLEPGYRMDALVKINRPGAYLLVDLAVDVGLRDTPERLGVLARIEVAGEPLDMALPSSESLAGLAPYPHVEDAELTSCQKTVFNVGTQLFTVNDRAYDPADPACKVPLGEAEEWRLSSDSANHPFHIHVNPFEIQEPNELGHKVWKDTVLVTSTDTTTVRTRYRRFDGEFVMHCHILDHEDQGMMITVDVMENPPAPGSEGTSCVPCDEEV